MQHLPGDLPVSSRGSEKAASAEVGIRMPSTPQGSPVASLASHFGWGWGIGGGGRRSQLHPYLKRGGRFSHFQGSLNRTNSDEEMDRHTRQQEGAQSSPPPPRSPLLLQQFKMPLGGY